MDLVAAGFNHKFSFVDFLNTVSFLPETLPSAYETLLSLPAVREAVILSTCNRSEIYAVVSELHEGIRALRTFFQSICTQPDSVFPADQFRHFSNDRMVFHLFATISGLESLVVGETQIAGQIRTAYRMALENAAPGPILNRLFHHAFEVNKRVRAKTRIGNGVVSVGHAAVQLAEKIFYPLKDRQILIIGAGETAQLAAKHFQEKAATKIWIANRTFSRAQHLANEIGGQPLTLRQFPDFLPFADIVVSATNAPDFLLTAGMIREIFKKRENRPLFLVDLAVPADFDPAIRHLENVYLYNLDDLRHIVEKNRLLREKETHVARTIIREEVQFFLKWLKEQQIVPTIQELRRHFETIRLQELSRFREKFSEEEWQLVEELTRRMTNKMLHTPTVKLKELFENPDGIHKISVIKQLFELEKA